MPTEHRWRSSGTLRILLSAALTEKGAQVYAVVGLVNDHRARARRETLCGGGTPDS